MNEERRREAEDILEVIEDDMRSGQPPLESAYMSALVKRYYPEDRDGQVRLLAFISDVADWTREHQTFAVPKSVALEFARKWDVERVLVQEVMELLRNLPGGGG